AEAEKKRLAEEKELKEKEAEKKRKEEAEKKRKEEEARKQRELEEALQAELEAEQQAIQDQQDLSEIQKYTILIGRTIEGQFNRLGLPDGLSCEILIRLLEGGNVADVSIAKSSGNELFDKRAEDAVYKASPLPVPDEPRVFNKMRTIQILFRPKS
ncbi:MAG: cell envelope integrity protein TolA, partial [Pseudomonadota bacterium]